MNLVKISEDLKDLPLQAVQAYMNGTNPEVPPYLAQAEMMRRQKQMENQQIASGAEQGQQPSIKEQLEKAAGLMSLQQQRSQQAQQQVGQQAQGAPVPTQEGTPQPAQQPEAQGVAGLPVPDEMFAMASGGVVGYADGGEVESLQARLAELRAAKERYARANSDTRGIDQAIAFAEKKLAAAQVAPVAAPKVAPLRPSAPARPTPQGIEKFVAPPEPAKPFEPTAPAPAAAAPAAPDETPEGLARGILSRQLKETPTQYTPEIAGATEGKLAEQSGLAGLASQREAMRKQYEGMEKDRSLSGLISVLSARGPNGPAQAYLGALGRKNDADMAFADRMYGYDSAPAEKRYSTQGQLYRDGTAEQGKLRDDQREAARALLGGNKPNSTERERMFERLQALRAAGDAEGAAALEAAWKALGSSGGDGDKFEQQIVLELTKQYESAVVKPKKPLNEYIAEKMSLIQQAMGKTGAPTPTPTATPRPGGTMPSPAAFASQYGASAQKLRQQLGQ